MLEGHHIRCDFCAVDASTREIVQPLMDLEMRKRHGDESRRNRLDGSKAVVVAIKARDV